MRASARPRRSARAPSGSSQTGRIARARGAGGLSRNLWNTSRKEFLPRIGFAYSMTPKTVLRGGYGIYYEPLGVINVQVNQTGFNSSTTFVGSLDNGQSYVANLTNPFSGGFTISTATRVLPACGCCCTSRTAASPFVSVNASASFPPAPD